MCMDRPIISFKTIVKETSNTSIIALSSDVFSKRVPPCDF